MGFQAKEILQSVRDREYKALDISVEERGEPATKRQRTQYYSPRMKLGYVLAKKSDSDEAEDEYTRWQKDLLPTNGDFRNQRAY